MKTTAFIVFLFSFSLLRAAEGDTTRVRTHDKVLIQTDPSKGHTEYSAWGAFPAAGKTYHKMYAELTFQCPPGMTCGEWDYLNYIFIGKRRGAHNDTLNWEIMRMITPYGLQFNSTWKHIWKFDITDFASLFTDSVEIWYQHTGYEAKNGRGWLITIDFTMIEGPEIRPVKNISMLWRKSVPYGQDSLFEAQAPEVKYTCGNETRQIRYKIIQTGHGMDQPDNCAEFCPKYRYLRHDNETDTTLVWRDNCGANPVFPQAGTWIYDRTNWCPGADVLEYNLDKFTQPGSEHSMDLDMQSYTRTGSSGNYMITAYLIEYGEHAFQTDAAITDVIRPTEDLQYKRLNPACGEPRVVVSNTGKKDISHLVLDYGWDGYQLQRYTWTGKLAFGESDTLDLPWLKTQATDGVRFVCRLVWVNGQLDDFRGNDRIYTLPVTKTAVLPNKIEIVLRTNNAPTENYYTLRKSDGTIIMKRDNFPKATTMRETVELADGCYELNLMDDGTPLASYPLNEDGLGWWANSGDGTGLFQVRNPVNNTLIQAFNVDFGTGIWYQFRVGGDVPPADLQAKIAVYPNPAQHDILIDLGKNSGEELHILLYSPSGKLVLEETRKGMLDALQYVDVTHIANGLYILKIQSGNATLTQQILLN